jgi:hypothetical protein
MKCDLICIENASTFMLGQLFNTINFHFMQKVKIGVILSTLL